MLVMLIECEQRLRRMQRIYTNNTEVCTCTFCPMEEF